MMARIDAWLIAHIYQAIVDISQRSPAWWAENCSYVCAVFGMIGLMRHGLVDGFGFWICFGIFFTMLGLFLVVFLVRSPILLAVVGRFHSGRYFWLWLTVIGIVCRAIVEFTLDRVVLSISDLGYLSFLYFACCEPPRPRTRLNFAGGTA